MMSRSNVKKKKKNKKTFKERLMNIGSKSLDGKLKNPAKLLFWFQILTIGLVLVSGGDSFTVKNTLVFVAYMVIVNLSNRVVSKITSGDNYLMLISSMLFSIGIVMIYRLNSGEGLKQIIWYIVGTVTFYIVYYILKSFRGWENLTILYGIGCLAMFAITLLFGTYKNGATNWVNIGGFSFQLSELSKILYVFYTASFQVNTKFLSKFKYRDYVYMATSYIFIGLFFIQKDLGSAVIFYAIYIISLFVFNYDKKIIIGNLLLAVVGAVMAYFMFSHIQTRVTIWLDPWAEAQGRGYQIIQSLFAVAAGGFFGTGLRLGRPDLIPIATSDFIFPAIVEEMGIFAGMGIIMLFMILVYRGFKISMEQQNYFFKFVAMGISILFAVQAVVMIGGVLKLIPMTGITIPFLSYGGSSMVSSFICLGILQYSSSDTRGKMVD